MSFATINNAELWYDIRGSGPPILLHHGYTASRVNWEPAAALLTDDFQVILMECRGTGASEHTRDGYSLEQYCADVVGLLDHLGLARVTFAGHSMGGGVGYLLGLDHPDRLNGLILMAPIPIQSHGIVELHLRSVGAVHLAFEQHALGYVELAAVLSM